MNPADASSSDQAMRDGARPPGAALFRFEEVGKSYKMGEETVHALRDVVAEVRTGEFLAVRGPEPGA